MRGIIRMGKTTAGCRGNKKHFQVEINSNISIFTGLILMNSPYARYLIRYFSDIIISKRID